MKRLLSTTWFVPVLLLFLSAVSFIVLLKDDCGNGGCLPFFGIVLVFPVVALVVLFALKQELEAQGIIRTNIIALIIVLIVLILGYIRFIPLFKAEQFLSTSTQRLVKSVEVIAQCFTPEEGPCTCEAIGCCEPNYHGVQYDWQSDTCKKVSRRQGKPPFESVQVCEDLCLGVAFRDLGQGYIEFENRIYRNQAMIIGADPTSFEVLDSNYSRDNNYVYYTTYFIDGADPSTFRLLEYPYAEDDTSIFRLGEVDTRKGVSDNVREESYEQCGTIKINQQEYTICAECGNGVCERYERGTGSSFSCTSLDYSISPPECIEMTYTTFDAGPVYCPQDCL